MISVLYNLGLCSETGIINNGTEGEACKVFNIHFSDVPYHYPIESKYFDGPLLIGIKTPNLHCVRLWKQEEPAKIIVMDPEAGEFKYWGAHKSLVATFFLRKLICHDIEKLLHHSVFNDVQKEYSIVEQKEKAITKISGFLFSNVVGPVS